MVASVPSCCSHLLEAHPSPKQNHVGPSHHPRPLPQSDSSTIRGWSTHGSIPGASSAWGGNHRTWVPSLPLGTRRSPSRCTGRAQSRSGYSYILGGGGVQGVRAVRRACVHLQMGPAPNPTFISLVYISLSSVSGLPGDAPHKRAPGWAAVGAAGASTWPEKALYSFSSPGIQHPFPHRTVSPGPVPSLSLNS